MASVIMIKIKMLANKLVHSNKSCGGSMFNNTLAALKILQSAMDRLPSYTGREDVDFIAWCKLLHASNHLHKWIRDYLDGKG